MSEFPSFVKLKNILLYALVLFKFDLKIKQPNIAPLLPLFLVVMTSFPFISLKNRKASLEISFRAKSFPVLPIVKLFSVAHWTKLCTLYVSNYKDAFFHMCQDFICAYLKNVFIFKWWRGVFDSKRIVGNYHRPALFPLTATVPALGNAVAVILHFRLDSL